MNDGGQAFPTDGEYSGYVKGMTLRDYLAAAALQGYLAAHGGEGVNLPTKENSARWAYACADEMLKAREPKKE